MLIPGPPARSCASSWPSPAGRRRGLLARPRARAPRRQPPAVPRRRDLRAVAVHGLPGPVVAWLARGWPGRGLPAAIVRELMAAAISPARTARPCTVSRRELAGPGVAGRGFLAAAVVRELLAASAISPAACAVSRRDRARFGWPVRGPGTVSAERSCARSAGRRELAAEATDETRWVASVGDAEAGSPVPERYHGEPVVSLVFVHIGDVEEGAAADGDAWGSGDSLPSSGPLEGGSVTPKMSFSSWSSLKLYSSGSPVADGAMIWASLRRSAAEIFIPSAGAA